MRVGYAYLHGFASGPLSRKGRHLQQGFAAVGLPLQLPDLNTPSFSRLTVTGALDAVSAMDRASGVDSWCLIGSSLGGYLAARWAQLHPDRVRRLLLLCPGFKLVERWPELLGGESMRMWRQQGHFLFPNGAGELTPVHYRFFEDALEHPPVPEVVQPTRILHGVEDPIVPIATSREYAAGRPHVELIELEDGHQLTASRERILQEALSFFEVEAPT